MSQQVITTTSGVKHFKQEDSFMKVFAGDNTETKRIEENKKKMETDASLNKMEDQYEGMDQDDNTTVTHLKSLMTHGAKAGKGRLMG
jgi:hypothetical protein